jgi:hypothetical protein
MEVQKAGGQVREPKVRGQSESLKLPPFSWFYFFVVFLCALSSLCLRRRRRRRECVVIFFCGGLAKNNFFKNDGNVLSFSFVVMLQRKRQ